MPGDGVQLGHVYSLLPWVTGAFYMTPTDTRPTYYTSGADDLIAHWLATGRTDAIMGNIQKYVERAGHKGATLPDLLKAKEYLDRWIEFELRANPGDTTSSH